MRKRPLARFSVFAAAMLLASTGLEARGEAASPEPPSREPDVLLPLGRIATPLERIRWLRGDDSLVVASDLRHGLAAITPESGTIHWTHIASGGRLDSVWVRGDRVVVAGADLTVLDRRTGRLVWSRPLGCVSRAQCAGRVHAVDADSVYVAGGGQVHRELLRLAVLDGRVGWPKAASVRHPRAVLVGRKVVAAQDGTRPFTLRFFDRRDGAALSTWTPTWNGEPRPPDGWAFTGKDQLVASFRAGDAKGYGDVLHIDARSGEATWKALGARLGQGQQVTSLILGARRALAHVPGAHTATLFGLPGGQVEQRIVGEPLPEPALDGSRALVLATTPDATRLLALDLDGGGGWESQVPGGWRAVRPMAGEQPMAVLAPAGEGAIVLVHAADSGRVVAGGHVDLDPEAIETALATDTRVFLAAGKTIHSLGRRPVALLSVTLRRALAEERFEDAEHLWSHARPMSRWSATVKRLGVIVDQERLARARETDLGEPDGLVALLALLPSEAGVPLEELATGAAALTEKLAELLARAKRLRGEAWRLRLAEIAARLAERVEDHRPEALGRHAVHAPLSQAHRVLAALLVAVKAPEAAAALLGTWVGRSGRKDPADRALYRGVALSLLERRLKEHARDLKSRDAGVRGHAVEVLTRSRHATAALAAGDDFVERISAAAASREAGRSLSSELRGALRSARRELGRGLGEAGCRGVCEALSDRCRTSCFDPAECEASRSGCARGCRGGKVRWRLPRTPPEESCTDR